MTKYVYGRARWAMLLLLALGFLSACIAVLVSGYNWDEKMGAIAVLLISAGVVIGVTQSEVE
jgi:uncharacterized membrane protein